MPGVFAISDTHLPVRIQVKKFGYPFDYFEQVREHLLKFNPELLLIAGDFSWESNFKRGLATLETIEELPGSKKVFIEGNHDTFCHRDIHREMLCKLFNKEDFYFLSGRALIVDVNKGDADALRKIGLCGAMGWMVHPRACGTDDLIMFQRQFDVLKTSLNQLEKLRDNNLSDFNICLIHHPPTYDIYTDHRIGDDSYFTLIKEYKFINAIIYGHIHKENRFKIYKKISGIDLYCSAIDQLGFKAIRIQI
ncbi:MAG: metallophosphoesterase [Candidatus Hodarchaeota archaeon]